MLQYVSSVPSNQVFTNRISLQYHQIVIFTHRPWVSKSYIQPRAPRQGPGYHHARRMVIESSIAIARLLHIYEKNYTFRRMNNQVVSMIFSAALILLYVTISTTPLASKTGFEQHSDSNTQMVAHLNLCFRALDELGQSFENAKRTRDFLVSLQRRWQARMRRSGGMKRGVSGSRNRVPQIPATTKDIPGTRAVQNPRESSFTRKKSRVSAPTSFNPSSIPFSMPGSQPHPSTTLNPSLNPSLNPDMGPGPALGNSAPFQSTLDPNLKAPLFQPPTNPIQHPMNPPQQPDIDSWIRNSDVGFLPGDITDSATATAAASAFRMGGAGSVPVGVDDAGAGAGVDVGLPSLDDIEPWWDAGEGQG